MAEGTGFTWRKLIDGGMLVAMASGIWGASAFYTKSEQTKRDVEDLTRQVQLLEQDRTRFELRLQRVELRNGIGASSSPEDGAP